MVGRILAVLCAGLVVFVFSTGTGSADVAAMGCAHPCRGAAQSVTETGHPTPLPCIRDVGCAGGAALGSGAGIAAVVVVVTAVAALGLGQWRRRRTTSSPLAGRLLAGGLFRPPRVLFDA